MHEIAAFLSVARNGISKVEIGALPSVGRCDAGKLETSVFLSGARNNRLIYLLSVFLCLVS